MSVYDTTGTNLTADRIRALAARLGPPLAQRYYVVKPEHYAKLAKEMVPMASEIGFPVLHIYAKDQAQDAWQFGDATLLKAYLNGDVAESELYARLRPCVLT